MVHIQNGTHVEIRSREELMDVMKILTHYWVTFYNSTAIKETWRMFAFPTWVVINNGDAKFRESTNGGIPFSQFINQYPITTPPPANPTPVPMPTNQIRVFPYSVPITGWMYYMADGHPEAFNSEGEIIDVKATTAGLVKGRALRKDSAIACFINAYYEGKVGAVDKTPPPPDESKVEAYPIAAVNGIELFVDPASMGLSMNIWGKVVPATEEMFISLRENLSKVKKLSTSFQEDIESGDMFKMSDRVLLLWPTGSGKTHLYHATAKKMLAEGKADNIEKITITEGFEDLDFLVYILPNPAGWMKYVEREVVTKLREASQGKKMVLCLDELNRGSRSFMNFILTMLDGVEDDNYVINNHVKDEKIVIPCENLLVFATMNIGSKYTGTSALDEALMDRFSHVRYVGYNLVNEEVIIDKAFTPLEKEVKDIIAKIRELSNTNDVRTSISTRWIKNWANAFINTPKTKKDLVSTFTDSILYKIVNMDEFGKPNDDDIKLVMREFHTRGLIDS